MDSINTQLKSINNKRLKRDITQLKTINCNLEIIKARNLTVILKGPKDSLYEDGSWKINIEIPAEYPFKSPSIGFLDKIYHPNVDYKSGTICMDVLNQEWAPIYSLLNIYETFLPQLLMYPNAGDPLNTEAGDLMLNDLEKFKTTVKTHILKS